MVGEHQQDEDTTAADGVVELVVDLTHHNCRHRRRQQHVWWLPPPQSSSTTKKKTKTQKEKEENTDSDDECSLDKAEADKAPANGTTSAIVTNSNTTWWTFPGDPAEDASVEVVVLPAINRERRRPPLLTSIEFRFMSRHSVGKFCRHMTEIWKNIKYIEYV